MLIKIVTVNAFIVAAIASVAVVVVVVAVALGLENNFIILIRN